MFVEGGLKSTKPAADLYLPFPTDLSLISENDQPVPAQQSLADEKITYFK